MGPTRARVYLAVEGGGGVQGTAKKRHLLIILTWVIGLLALAAGALLMGLSAAVEGDRPAGTAWRQAGGIAFVDINRAEKAHHLFARIEQLESQLRRHRQSWDRYAAIVKSHIGSGSEADLYARLYLEQSEALQARVEADIREKHRQLQSRLAEMKGEAVKRAEAALREEKDQLERAMEEELDAAAAGLQRQLDQESERLRTGYSKRILNLQVELILGRLSPHEEQERLQQIESLRKELQERLALLAERYSEKLEAERSRLEKKYAVQLKAVERKIETRVKDELAGQQAAAEREIAHYAAAKERALQAALQRKQDQLARLDVAAAGEGGKGFSQAAAVQRQIEAELLQQIDEFRQEIRRDLKRAAAEVAQVQGLQAVVIEGGVSAGGIDITEAVINALVEEAPGRATGSPGT